MTYVEVNGRGQEAGMAEIFTIEHPISPGLAEEIKAVAESMGEFDENEFDSKYPDLDSFLGDWARNAGGLEFIERLRNRSLPSKILDIGVGGGHSSIYLASQGHQVSSVEPSYLLCRHIAYASNKFKLPLDIYNCTAEAVDRIPARDFDICIFNSSLHHCDEPVKALKNGHSVLKENGSVLVLNELLLKFYKSRKSFHDALLNDPIRMGHYGGNEHAYSYSEYKKLLKKAGFSDIREYIDFRNCHPRPALAELMSKKIKNEHVHSENDLLIRFIYLMVIDKICRSRTGKMLFLPILKKLSLIQISFEGVK
jgi:SAM-dependent methyltransferase